MFEIKQTLLTLIGIIILLVAFEARAQRIDLSEVQYAIEKPESNLLEEFNNDTSTEDYEAITFYEQSKDGNDKSALALAHCYNEGLFIESDEDKSWNWLLEAARQGNITALDSLANNYLMGIVVDKDPDKAKLIYQYTCQNGSKVSCDFIGQKFVISLPREPEEVKTDIDEILEAEEVRELEAIEGIAEESPVEAEKETYSDENELQENAEEDAAFAYYKQYMRQAAEGNPEAHFNLSELFKLGIVVKNNIKKEIHHLEESSKGHFAKGSLFLGKVYHSGRNGKKNIKKAIQYYELAAEQGSAFGYLELGILYFKGKEVELDQEKGLINIKKAAEMDLPAGAYLYGFCLSEGIGVVEDKDLGLYWLKKAADKGDQKAADYIASHF